MIDLGYPALLDLFKEHIAPPRTESASFLIWYLENYYRLDTTDAIDAVCDQSKDKGVDGIYVNDNNTTITIFQAKISQKKDSFMGDVLLKEFLGTLSQFESQKSIQELISSPTTAPALIRLINSLDLINKIEDYDVRGVFVANIDLNDDGKLFLKHNPIITYIGKTDLVRNYISQKRTMPIYALSEFDVSSFPTSEYIVDTNTRALIAPIKAIELVNLQGIADQSLFAFNVRGPLGQTQVNKDIVRSIKDPSTHKLFPLFHNGITIICSQLKNNADKIQIKDYYVVNGCQSLSSLYDNQANITDDLRILTKFIQVDVASKLSENITRFSNNQNGVKARDFKSNHPIQIRLQNEFVVNFKNQYSLEVKRGELDEPGETIPNELAGLYLMSFDLKEPWATHRKYQVFEDKYTDLFGRPAVTADRIVMCYEIVKVIDVLSEKINNRLFGKYALTRFVLLYMVRCILENDDVGRKLIDNPEPFIRPLPERTHFTDCINKMVEDIIIDVNGEVDEYGNDFDYRGKLRDEVWVKELSKKVVGNYLKLVQRKRIDSFGTEWNHKGKK